MKILYFLLHNSLKMAIKLRFLEPTQIIDDKWTGVTI